jgi:hypothetical protein
VDINETGHSRRLALGGIVERLAVAMDPCKIAAE